MKLHLVNDEKIVNRTVELFEQESPGDNLFVVDSKSDSFKLVKERDCVISIKQFYKNRMDHRSFDEIYIHYLNRHKMELINRLDLRESKVYWIIWGADLYNKLLAPKGFRLYMPDTWGDSVKDGIFTRWNKLRRTRRNVSFVKDKVDFIVTDSPDLDYRQLLEYYPELSGKKWKGFIYYPIDNILGSELLHKNVDGNAIMVGNSASATNNHEYIFSKLSKLNLGCRKVIVPLSYNGKKKYIERVDSSARKLIPENYCPLTEFLPLDEYNRIQIQSGFACFGNLRQEAMGNIVVALYLGAKVFLMPGNPIYTWALNHGLVVFDMEAINQDDINTPLPSDIRIKNREILSELYSSDRLLSLIKSLKDEGADC